MAGSAHALTDGIIPPVMSAAMGTKKQGTEKRPDRLRPVIALQMLIPRMDNGMARMTPPIK